MPFNKENLAPLRLNVENERHMRLLMDAAPQGCAQSIFLTALRARFGMDFQLPVIAQALKWAFEIEYQHGTVPSSVYLNHPLRVATILVQEMGVLDEETLAIALLHNVLEVSDVSKDQLKNVLGASIAEAIDALTVDRLLQNDISYKEKYYARIEATSFACARVKIADKLDNIYMLCFNASDEVRCNYLNEIDRWVVPMAWRVIPVLAERIEGVCAVLSKTGFLDR